MTDALHLVGVAKAFGGVLAVADVTMSVPAGQITGLIGPNGAGKTTLVNLITGVYALSEGEIRFGESRLTEAPAHIVGRAGIARTFQNIRLLPEASVLENVMIGFHRHERGPLWAELLGLPAARRETAGFRERGLALLDRFGMRHYAGSEAGGLSYGDQRRVEMMRALASEPAILLLDEPVAGMNDVEAERLGTIFGEVAASGVGLLLIEHNVRFVTRMCRHVYVLDSGRLIAEGPAREVVTNPAVVTAYLGN